jgi:3-oxoacyl-[acyl-carrier protein] reductase
MTCATQRLLAALLPFFVIPAATMSQTCAGRLAGQRVLVTGAGRGIGRAIALTCGQEGATVAISSWTVSELEETSEAMTNTGSSDVYMYVADVTNREQVEKMVESVVAKMDCIDILINNAGGAQSSKGPSHTLDSDDLKRLLDLNVVSVHMVTSAVLRHSMMETGGRIINISSRAGKVGLANYSFYCATKFALEGLTATLAEELRDKNILVNSLSPGMVDTKSFPKPQGRKGVRTAESVRDGLLVLLESEVTGHYLHVDELDQARERGLDDSAALKPINEPPF